MSYQRWNIILGWSTFLIAAIVFISTIEPTTSFWDTGEFIATSYKLEVGHPPGAPFFMLVSRLFMSFVSPEMAPVMANLISALSSAFTVLFLFWSVTHLARKMVGNKEETEISGGQIAAVLASGFIGAMAFTFSDSFWFSAVEGEVYAMSSLLTASVFWAILKWETVADERHSLRWLILIAFIMGISIGVHLLNLLAIPAICFVYYFRRYKPSRKGFLYTILVAILILGVIQAGIIPGLVSWAGKFELFFINSLGLPFNTGVIIYSLLILGLILFGLRWTKLKDKPVFHTIILGVLVIILGYSSFATIAIRSAANPPMDENNPENVFTLLSYLNREQYGDRPLLYGHYWNAPLDAENPKVDGDPVRMKAWLVKNETGTTLQSYNSRWDAEQRIEKESGKNLHIEQEYIISDPKIKSEYNYDPKFETIFPRMYSSQSNHVQAYKRWSNFEGKPIRTTGNDGQPQVINKPTMIENLRFFFTYQVNFMYWRYFMWNFSGRQNDIQGHGNLLEGNWLSGVDFIDEQRLGPQDNLPDSMTSNHAYNRFYMLPFILGIIGLLYQLYRNPKDWFVVFLLFFFTGLAIVIYLNQYPYQPRERDYAYAGSYYAFAMWIGLGTFALFDMAKRIPTDLFKKILGYAGIAFAVIYLFEMIGGNDHFLSYSIGWIAGVGLVASGIMFLLGKSVKNDMALAMVAGLLTLPVPILMAADGWDDHDRSGRYTARDFAINYLETTEPNSILFTNGDNDTFPLWYAQEVEGVRTDVRVVNLSLLNTDWYIDQMKRKAYESEPVPFGMEEPKYRQGTRDVVLLDNSRNPKGIYVDVDRAIRFVSNPNNKVRMNYQDEMFYFPTKKFSIPVDKQRVIDLGVVAPEDSAEIVDAVNWTIERSYVLKNHLMVLDLLAHNDWERPIYFAVTTGPDSYLNLQNHFSLEGLAYRLVPIKSPQNQNPNFFGTVNTERMYEVVTEKFKWGGMDSEEEIYMDDNNLRMTTNLRLQMSNLAEKLVEEEKIEKARDILDLAMEKMPERNVPFDRIMIPMAENYYSIGDDEKANHITERLFEIYSDNLDYYLSLDPQWASQMQQDMRLAFLVNQRLKSLVNELYPQEELKERINSAFGEYEKAYYNKMQEIEQYNRGVTKGSF